MSSTATNYSCDELVPTYPLTLTAIVLRRHQGNKHDCDAVTMFSPLDWTILKASDVYPTVPTQDDPLLLCSHLKASYIMYHGHMRMDSRPLTYLVHVIRSLPMSTRRCPVTGRLPPEDVYNFKFGGGIPPFVTQSLAVQLEDLRSKVCVRSSVPQHPRLRLLPRVAL